MITVVSCGMGYESLTPAHIHAVSHSTVLVGARRLLGMFPDFKGEKVCLDRDIPQKIQEVFQRYRHKEIVVLASGDSLFYGIGAVVKNYAQDIPLTFIPNTTSVQAGLARLGIAYPHLQTYSVHGRSNSLPLSRLVNQKLVAILCDALRNPASIAQDIIAYYPPSAKRRCAVAENIGLADEKLFISNLENIIPKKYASLSILYLLPDTTPSRPLSLGSDDSAYHKDGNCITHPEVRAVVLSKLRLRPHSVVWDLGAGSGSVGIEAATIAEGIAVHAVEKEKKRYENIQRNSAAFGVDLFQSYNDDILNVIDKLPQPDSIFIGGGGRDIASIIQKALERMSDTGVMVVTAVLQTTVSSILATDAEIEDIEIQVRRSKKVGTDSMMIVDNPVRIFTLQKRKTI